MGCMGVPLYRWMVFVRENPIWKWMIARGTPIVQETSTCRKFGKEIQREIIGKYVENAIIPRQKKIILRGGILYLPYPLPFSCDIPSPGKM